MDKIELKFKKRNKIFCEIRLFHVIHEVVQRWQRIVKKRLTHVRSCLFAYYTSSIFDILIAIASLALKVPIRFSYVLQSGD